VSENFYTILTNAGLAAIANAVINQTQVNFAKLGVGDGNGAYYTPTQEATALRNQVWIGNISSVTADTTNPNWVNVETVIPGNVGGFEIRELGIFDDNNVLLAIGKLPLTYKPNFAEGSSKDLYIKVIFEVTNASAVTLKVDPSVIYASKKYVDDKVATVVSGLENVQQQLNQQTAAIDTKLNTHIKDDSGHVWYVGAGGTLNAISVTSDKIILDNTSPPKPKQGSAYRIFSNFTNTGNVTLKVSDGVKTSNAIPLLRGNGTQLPSGTMTSGGIYTVAFNGTNFILQGESGVTSPETNRTTFNTPGTHSWVVPENVTRIVYRAWGAGGGGGGNCRYYQSMGGGGGGAGAYIAGFLKVTPGTTLSILVGEGGTGGSPNTVSGQANLIYAGVGGHSGVVGGFYAYGGGGGATPENRAGYVNGGAGAGATLSSSGGSGGVLKINPSKNGGPQAPSAVESQIRGIIVSFSGGDGWYTDNGQGGGGGGAPSDGAGGLAGPTTQTGKIFTEGAKGGVGGPMGQSGEIGNRGSGGGGAGSYNGSTSLFGSRGGHGFVEIVW